MFRNYPHQNCNFSKDLRTKGKFIIIRKLIQKSSNSESRIHLVREFKLYRPIVIL